MPDTPDGWRNEGLADKWARIRTVRRGVTAALEIERREKRIGSSLEAAPTVFIEDAALREAVGDIDLAEVMITSAVTLSGETAPEHAFRTEDASGVAVLPTRATAHKCERCWRLVDDVGADPAHPALCGRCVDAVGA